MSFHYQLLPDSEKPLHFALTMPVSDNLSNSKVSEWNPNYKVVCLLILNAIISIVSDPIVKKFDSDASIWVSPLLVCTSHLWLTLYFTLQLVFVFFVFYQAIIWLLSNEDTQKVFTSLFVFTKRAKEAVQSATTDPLPEVNWQIRRVMRPTDVPDTGKFASKDMFTHSFSRARPSLWPSMVRSRQGFLRMFRNDRGVSFAFGSDVISRISQTQVISLIFPSIIQVPHLLISYFSIAIFPSLSSFVLQYLINYILITSTTSATSRANVPKVAKATTLPPVWKVGRNMGFWRSSAGVEKVFVFDGTEAEIADPSGSIGAILTSAQRSLLFTIIKRQQSKWLEAGPIFLKQAGTRTG